VLMATFEELLYVLTDEETKIIDEDSYIDSAKLAAIKQQLSTAGLNPDEVNGNPFVQVSVLFGGELISTGSFLEWGIEDSALLTVRFDDEMRLHDWIMKHYGPLPDQLRELFAAIHEAGFLDTVRKFWIELVLAAGPWSEIDLLSHGEFAIEEMAKEMAQTFTEGAEFTQDEEKKLVMMKSQLHMGFTMFTSKHAEESELLFAALKAAHR